MRAWVRNALFCLLLSLPVSLFAASPHPAEALARDIVSRISVRTDFVVERPKPGGPILAAADFGFSAEATAVENARSLERALDACRQQKASRLVFASGTYRLKRTEESTLTENPHYAGRIYVVCLTNLEDFVFDGNGAEFVFEELTELADDEVKQGAYFLIRDCKRVSVENLTVDWDWSYSALGFFGRIKAVDPGSRTVDYELPATGLTRDPRGLKVYGMRAWDFNRACRPPDGFSFAMDAVDAHGLKDPHTLRFRFKRARDMAGATPGAGGIFKTKTRFYAIGFVLDRNEHLTLDRITLHGCPANGIWARNNKFLALLNSRFTPRPGTTPVYVSHSALEIHNHLGFFRMEGKLIEWQHDDGLHLSDFFLPPNWERVDDHTVNFKGLMYFQSGDTFREGDRLTFRLADYAPASFTGTLEKFQWCSLEGKALASLYVTARFKEALPPNLSTNSMAFNESRFGVGQYVIRNNTIRNGLCHGLYLCMPNGLVESNTVSNVGYPALTLHSVLRWGRWPMGHPPTNVVIRGNLLERCNTALRPPADLFVGGGVEPPGKKYAPVPNPVAAFVLIENNTVRETPGPALVLWSCRNVVARGNTFVSPNLLPNRPEVKGALFVRDASRVAILNNRLLDPQGRSLEKALIVDEASTVEVWATSNPGFQEPVR